MVPVILHTTWCSNMYVATIVLWGDWKVLDKWQMAPVILRKTRCSSAYVTTIVLWKSVLLFVPCYYLFGKVANALNLFERTINIFFTINSVMIGRMMNVQWNRWHLSSGCLITPDKVTPVELRSWQVTNLFEIWNIGVGVVDQSQA